MNLDLKGKIAIVTGGSEGIGRSISETLSREGVKVSICSRRFDILNDAAIDITKRTGVEVLPIQADVTNVEDIDNLVNSTVTHFGGVDILVNNAGTAASKYFEDVSDELWNSDLDLKFSLVEIVVDGIALLLRSSFSHSYNMTLASSRSLIGANDLVTYFLFNLIFP